MTVQALQQLVGMGRQELAQADWMLGHHQPFMYGLCRCHRVWPCAVAAQYGKAARYWRVRLAVLEVQLVLVAPTQRLPQVRP